MNGIKFERQGTELVIRIDLKAALAGRLSTGRPGSHGEGKGEFNGKPFKVGLNVMEAGKLTQVAAV